MWDILLWILLFIGGYIIIYYAADIFIDNLKDFCLVYGLSAFIIGSIVLGIDLEEFIASTVASTNGLPYIAVGNVIGNSIIALTLCFALPALFFGFKFKAISQFYFWIIYASFFAIILGFFFHFGLLIAGLVTIALYLIYLLRNLKHSREQDIEEIKKVQAEENEDKSRKKIILLIIISFCAIVLGGELLILSAQHLITLTGISESIFGFVIIAFVTNVEELTLIIKSIKKHAVEIGLGGMVGKLIWNLTVTFGISGLILINIVFHWDLIWNSIVLLILLLYLNYIARKRSLNKKDGILLLIFFVVFLLINFI
ncbi:MAG TPA: hypothetical protein VMV49_13380 [Candidatus Deferrimicrobium sp.]|nr:hypothetical protein [Candidatus Deferrimicrobium sp.]